MQKSSILSIIGIVFGVIGAILAFFFSVFDNSVITNGFIALFSSFLAIPGIWLIEKNNKITVVQYLICGFGLLMGISLFGVLGFLFFIIAALVAFTEKTSEPEIKPNEQDITKIIQQNKNKKLWIIPLVTLIIIIIVAAAGQYGYSEQVSENSNALNLTNISSNIETSYGLTSGDLTGTLTSSKDFDGLSIKVLWYSGDTLIDTTYDSKITGSITANQGYAFDVPYYSSNTQKPTKAEIQISNNLENQTIYDKNVTLP